MSRHRKPYPLWPNRDPLHNCFVMPNEVFQMDLSVGAKIIYAYLRYIEDHNTYECNAKYDTIGRAVGMSRNTVMKYVSELEERGLISTKRMAATNEDGQVQLGSLRYTLLPIRNAMELYHKRLEARAEAEAERYRVQQKLAAQAGKEERPL